MQRKTRSSAIASRKITSGCASARTRTTTVHRKYFHAQSSSGRDRRVGCLRQPLGGQRRRQFLGRGFELDLDRDGINDLPHRELDLFGDIAPRFSRDRISFRQSGGETPALRERARGIPGMSSIEDPAPLTSHFWKIRAQRSARAAQRSQIRQRNDLRLHNITKSFGRNAILRGISLQRGAEANHVDGWAERRRQKHNSESACGIDSPKQRHGARQRLRRRPAKNRGATCDSVFAATTEFSSQADLSRDPAVLRAVCAAFRLLVARHASN